MEGPRLDCSGMGGLVPPLKVLLSIERFSKEFSYSELRCFYNGTSEESNRKGLKASDILIKSPGPLKIRPSIEITVTARRRRNFS